MAPSPDSDASPVVVLDYSRPATVSGISDPRLCAAARLMVGLAVLSGLCVAACFAAMAWGTPGALLHTLIFAATLLVALRVGVLMGAAGALGARQCLLDGIAGIALILIGVAPAVVVFVPELNWERPGTIVLGITFGALAATTYRHLLLYRALYTWAAAAGQIAFGRRLIALGYTKAVYEAIWLGCCAVSLFAVGLQLGDDIAFYPAVAALLGCLGYGVIWIWMIVAHARLAISAR